MDFISLALGLVGAPAPLYAAFSSLLADGDAGLCRFIKALYAARETLGEAGFEALLGRVRLAMRRSLDRRLAYAS